MLCTKISLTKVRGHDIIKGDIYIKNSSLLWGFPARNGMVKYGRGPFHNMAGRVPARIDGKMWKKGLIW